MGTVKHLSQYSCTSAVVSPKNSQSNSQSAVLSQEDKKTTICPVLEFSSPGVQKDLFLGAKQHFCKKTNQKAVLSKQLIFVCLSALQSQKQQKSIFSGSWGRVSISFFVFLDCRRYARADSNKSRGDNKTKKGTGPH